MNINSHTQTSKVLTPNVMPPGEMLAYKVGDFDQRPWGSYKVIDVGYTLGGEEYCEKEIIVNPGHILSLQSHEHRRETWTVMKGTLTAILDHWRNELAAGQGMIIPKGGLHCMANLSDAPCIVHERQEGLCREDDIKRYMDAYSRDTESVFYHPAAAGGIHLYQSILNEIKTAAA